MASTEPTTSVPHSEKEDRLNADHTDIKPTKDLTGAADRASDAGTGPTGRSRDASPAAHSSASGPSSNKGGTQSPAPSGSASTPPPLSMPHPKKFSHVNINKKFLEKASASTPAHTSSASPTQKAANQSRTYYDVVFEYNITFVPCRETRAADHHFSSTFGDREANSSTAAQ